MAGNRALAGVVLARTGGSPLGRYPGSWTECPSPATSIRAFSSRPDVSLVRLL